MSANIQAIKEKWFEGEDPSHYLETDYQWRGETGPVVVDEDGNSFILQDIVITESLYPGENYVDLRARGLRLKKNGQVAERQGAVTSSIYLSLDDQLAVQAMHRTRTDGLLVKLS